MGRRRLLKVYSITHTASLPDHQTPCLFLWAVVHALHAVQTPPHMYGLRRKALRQQIRTLGSLRLRPMRDLRSASTLAVTRCWR